MKLNSIAALEDICFNDYRNLVNLLSGTEVEFQQDKILAFLNHSFFWKLFNIQEATPDGHCFIHSLVHTLCDFSIDILACDILHAIELECCEHSERYLPFFGDSSKSSFLKSMYEYIFLKRYDTSFGDVVPIVCSYALKININVIIDNDGFNSFHCIHDNDNDRCVFVLKRGDHYDALVPSISNDAAQVQSSDIPECVNSNSIAGQCYHSSNSQNNSALASTASEGINNYRPKQSDVIINGSSGTDVNHSCLVDNNADVPDENETGITNKSTCQLDKEFLNNLNKFAICFYNIHGLSVEKLSDDMLGSFFKRFMLIFLCETWTSSSDSNMLDILSGYSFYNICRKVKHPKSWRASGGLGIYIHKSIEHGLETISVKDDIIIIFKIKKEIFGLPFDIYVSNCYIVPENSTHLTDDVFAILQEELSKIPPGAGDLTFMDGNAHTNNALDFSLDIEGSDAGLNEFLPFDNCSNKRKIMDLYNNNKLQRLSLDSRPLNSHGHELLNLCKSSDRLILNSRIPGNDFKQGLLTHYNPDGSGGLLDYILCSPNMFNLVNNLCVHDKFPESDHCPISLEFPINSVKQCVASTSGVSSTVWKPSEYFEFSHTDMPKIEASLCQGMHENEYKEFKSAVLLNKESDEVANLFK